MLGNRCNICAGWHFTHKGATLQAGQTLPSTIRQNTLVAPSKGAHCSAPALKRMDEWILGNSEDAEDQGSVQSHADIDRVDCTYMSGRNGGVKVANRLVRHATLSVRQLPSWLQAQCIEKYSRVRISSHKRPAIALTWAYHLSLHAFPCPSAMSWAIRLPCPPYWHYCGWRRCFHTQRTCSHALVSKLPPLPQIL